MKILKLFLNVFLILIVFSSCKFINKSDKMIDNSIDTLITITEDFITDTNTDSTEIETIVQETEPITAPVESNAPTTGYGNNRFYMVVGSFLSEQLAQKYAKKMQDLGYQPQVIYSNSLGFFRVSAQSYDNYTMAINDIPNFRNNVTPRAWVHVKK